MFADAHGNVSDDSYVPYSTYSASGDSAVKVVTEAALKGGLNTKMGLVASAKAAEVIIASSTGDAAASGYKIGGTDKTNFGSTTEVAVESAVKDYVESIVPVVPEVIGKMDKVTTFTVGHIVTLVADGQSTPQGNAADSGYSIGATDTTNFGASTELAVESAVKSYADTEVAKKMTLVASTKAGEFIIASSTGDASASGYTLGVTVKTNFGAANKIATEAGVKAYADDVASAAQSAAETSIKAIIGGSYSSTSTVHAAITANTSAITVLNSDASTTGSVAKQVKDGDDAVKAIIGGSYSSTSTVAAAISANTGNITANTSAITVLNGDASTAGSVAKQVKDGDDAVKAIIGSGFSSTSTVATAVGANTSAITTLNGDASTAGSVAKKVKDGDDAVKAIIGGSYSSTSTVNAAITANASAITTLNGDSSTTGSVAKQVKDGDDAVKAIIGSGYSSSSTVASKISSLESSIAGKADKAQHTAALGNATITAKTVEDALVAGGMQHQIACTSATTVNLPTTAATFAGRSANVDIIVTHGSYNVVVTDGSQSETFAADSTYDLIYSFKTVKTGANTFAWRLFE